MKVVLASWNHFFPHSQSITTDNYMGLAVPVPCPCTFGYHRQIFGCIAATQNSLINFEVASTFVVIRSAPSAVGPTSTTFEGVLLNKNIRFATAA